MTKKITIAGSIELDAASPAAWGIVSDQTRDPEWRTGVLEMTVDPAGRPFVGTTTHEVIRVAGRTYVNDGIITGLVPGERLEWRTTTGVDAWGARTVSDVGEGRCAVDLELHVVPTGINRLLAPMLRRMMSRTMHADLETLRGLVCRTVEPTATASGRQGP